MAKVVPLELSRDGALRMIREIAADTNNIILTQHARKRAQRRRITRRQIELCVQKGTIQEGPAKNQKGNWQVNLYRHAAGEEITCVVAIERAFHVAVVSVF